ncbi:MAG TPA: S8 family serine peptidase, partial [Verrucomicrobiaceae bacterium]
PGEQIYSTFGATDTFYYSNTGSSFAAPYITGACALMLSRYPVETHQQIITRVLNATDPLPSLVGKCATGGRLNLRNALSPFIRLAVIAAAGGAPFQLRVTADPDRTCVIEVTMDLMNWSAVLTNTTSASGTFDFTDDRSTNSARRFYRAVSSP